MKKSHRSDVILARIVFAVFCMIVVAVIAGVVWYVKENHSSKKPSTEPSQSSESQVDSESESQEPVTPPETEPTQTEEVKPIVKTKANLRLRKEPNTNCDVLVVIPEGTRLEVLGEGDGWAQVEYQGKSGYVSMEYVEEVAQ